MNEGFAVIYEKLTAVYLASFFTGGVSAKLTDICRWHKTCYQFYYLEIFIF